MNESTVKWYKGWQNDLKEDLLTDLHKESVEGIMDYLESVLLKQSTELTYEVLNALPGHGKTTALKVFVKRILQQKKLLSGLIVLREKEQMRELEEFASGFNQGILYIDSDNYQKFKKHIPNYQFVIISHERFRNLALNQEITINDDLFTKWGDQQRLIIVDEAPSFVDSAIFDLGKSLKWIDNCFQAAPNEFSSEQKVLIRSIIQILIAEELIENRGLLTGPFKRHLDSDRNKKVLTRFFDIIDKHITRIPSIDSLNMYKWFKKLVNDEHAGYIDSGFYLDDYSDHKKIICSSRIDYKRLRCSILILDGTAIHTPSIYNNEFSLINLASYTKYERLSVYQRRINTTARQRKKRGSITHELITEDIRRIKKEGKTPFPLMNKFEVNIYRNLGVISKENYEQYFDFSTTNNKLPINLLNTIGKNHLANQTSLYLTSLPNRPAVYYKAIAISLYKDSEIPLNLSMNQKDKKDNKSWFADERIERIYHECLLGELFQIIHRSNIRNLTAPLNEKVHIYIATNFDHIVNSLVDMFKPEKRVTLERSNIADTLKFQEKIEQVALLIATKIEEDGINLPKSVGRIVDSNSAKLLINRNWKDELKKDEILAAFNRYGLDIVELQNKEKRVVSFKK